MNVIVNSNIVEIPEGSTVADVAAMHGCSEGKGVAIAVGGKICPHSRWNETPVAGNAEIVIIKAAYGG